MSAAEPFTIHKRQHILIAGFSGSGKKSMLRTLSQKDAIPDVRVVSTHTTLPCCSNSVMLHSFNPESEMGTLISPFLQAATAVIILISSTDTSANVTLQKLLNYFLSKNIEEIGIGVFCKSNDNFAFDMMDIYNVLDERGLTLPVAVVEENDKDDMLGLLEMVCLKANFH